MNAASKRDFSISEGKYKGKNANAKANAQENGFYALKCGIYLLNAALKRDLSISECKYKGKMERLRQMHRKLVFMP